MPKNIDPNQNSDIEVQPQKEGGHPTEEGDFQSIKLYFTKELHLSEKQVHFFNSILKVCWMLPADLIKFYFS